MKVRTAFVTGANKSIGFETARQLGELGYRVWLGARDLERGQSAAKTLVRQGLDVHPVLIDVTHEASVRDAANLIYERDGYLDVLINNAGIPGQQPIAPVNGGVKSGHWAAQ